MDAIRNATVPPSREDRNGIKNKKPPMVERAALGCLVIRKKSQGDNLERQADPTIAGTAAKLTA